MLSSRTSVSRRPSMSPGRTSMERTMLRSRDSSGHQATWRRSRRQADESITRVDVYAWGILTYELLAGEHPFATHAGPAQMVAAHISEHTEACCFTHRADTPVWLAKLVMQCLTKSPDARPANGGALLAAITHAVPRSQSEASSPERRRVSVSRFRMVAAVAVVALTIAAGLWFSPALFNNQREPAERSTPGATSDPTRMAVLYLDDLSDGKTLGTLAAGLTEDLIDKLSAVRALHVISPNGVRPLRGAALTPDSIGRRLNVGTIVGGSVASSEGRLRVVVRLIDAVSGQQLQSRTLERPFGELFALQDDLSTQVSTLLRERLGAEVRLAQQRAGTKSVRAWETVQRAEELSERGRALVRRGRTDSAMVVLRAADTLFAVAEQLDPSWLVPIVGRGWVAVSLAFLMPTSHDATCGTRQLGQLNGVAVNRGDRSCKPSAEPRSSIPGSTGSSR